MKKLLPTVILAGLVILALLLAIRDLDPATRAARESRERAVAAQEWARAEEQQARAEAASTWAAEWAEYAPDRAAALTWAAIGLLGVTLTAAAGVAVAGIVYVHLRAQTAGRLIQPGRSGLYPAIVEPGGGYMLLNEPRAQTLAALAAASTRRPTAAMVGRVIDSAPALPEPLPAPQIAGPTPLTAAEVVDVDPRERPHWLLVGSTGSGKTVAAYSILSELARRATCAFTICEPGGVNWGPQATATTTPAIAGAIIDAAGEMTRRQELLRLADVDHVADLPEPLPYRVLVLEETEAVLDDLRLTDRDLRTETIIALRAIARMGRKAGCCLVAITQAGTTDVFDAHLRKNIGNVLLFRSEHSVSETWRIPQRLTALPAGCAYSVTHGGLVQFQRAPRPQLVQPAVRGIPVDWPTTGAVAGGCSGSGLVVGGCEPVVQRLEPGREPSPQLAAQLRQLHAAGWSKTALCNAAWGYKDGAVWNILDRVLGGML